MSGNEASENFISEARDLVDGLRGEGVWRETGMAKGLNKTAQVVMSLNLAKIAARIGKTGLKLLFKNKDNIYKLRGYARTVSKNFTELSKTAAKEGKPVKSKLQGMIVKRAGPGAESWLPTAVTATPQIATGSLVTGVAYGGAKANEARTQGGDLTQRRTAAAKGFGIAAVTGGLAKGLGAATGHEATFSFLEALFGKEGMDRAFEILHRRETPDDPLK